MLSWVISSSVLILLLIGLRYLFLGKINARLQYALWALAAVRLLIPGMLFESSASVMRAVPDSWQASPAPAVFQQINLREDSGLSATAAPQAAQPAGAPQADAAAPQASLSAGEAQPETAAPFLSPRDILVFVWLAGAAAVGLWLIIGNALFYRRLRRRARREEVPGCPLPVYRAKHLSSPFLFGLIHPAIYLPSASSGQENRLEHILTHELTHWRHGDHLWSFVRGVCLALHWYNPLVWWAALLSKRDCELACDESTLKRLGEEHRQEYAMTLINAMAGTRKKARLLSGATTMAGGRRGRRERIRLLAAKRRILWSSVLTALVLAALAAGCTFSSAAPKESPAPSPSESVSPPDEPPGDQTLPDLIAGGAPAEQLVEPFARYYSEHSTQLMFLPLFTQESAPDWDALSQYIAIQSAVLDPERPLTRQRFSDLVNRYLDGVSYEDASSDFLTYDSAAETYTPTGWDWDGKSYFRLTGLSPVEDGVWQAQFDNIFFSEWDYLLENTDDLSTASANMNALYRLLGRLPEDNGELEETLFSHLVREDYDRIFTVFQKVTVTFRLSGDGEDFFTYLSCERLEQGTDGVRTARDLVTTAQNDSGVSDEILEAFITWIENEPDFLNTYGSGSWSWQIYPDPSGDTVVLRGAGPQGEDGAWPSQCVEYRDGEVFWGPSGTLPMSPTAPLVQYAIQQAVFAARDDLAARGEPPVSDEIKAKFAQFIADSDWFWSACGETDAPTDWYFDYNENGYLSLFVHVYDQPDGYYTRSSCFLNGETVMDGDRSLILES